MTHELRLTGVEDMEVGWEMKSSVNSTRDFVKRETEFSKNHLGMSGEFFDEFTGVETRLNRRRTGRK